MIANRCLSLNIFSKIFEKTSKIINGNSMPALQVQTGFGIFLPQDKRLVYNFHQEASYVRNYNDLTNILFPLFYKTSIRNGTTSVLDGSHKLGPLTYDKIRFSKNSYTTFLPKNIKKISNKYEETFCELDLGDVLYFHKDLIHRSNYNASDKCRTTCIIRLTQSLKNKNSISVVANLL